MKQNAVRKPNRGVTPSGQVLYLEDYLPEKSAEPPKLWERTAGIPEWLEQVSIWTESLTTVAMTVLSVGWMWYCMVCV